MFTHHAKTIAALAAIMCSTVTWAAPTQPPSDEWIEGKISGALGYNTRVDSTLVHVDSKAGNVVLSGKVPTEIERDYVAEIARSVEGVSGLENKIIVDETINAEPHSGLRQKLADAAATAAVKAKLLANRRTHGSLINVDTAQNVVTLSGIVASNDEKSAAERLAFTTNGVREVHNSLIVDGKSIRADTHAKDTEASVSDTWISTKTRALLNLSGDFPGSDVQVTTANGQVTLAGYARSPEQKSAIESAVAEVNGVRSVVNQLAVRKPISGA